MAFSYDYYKKEVKEYLVNKFDRKATILDVGAGCGTYYDLLHDYFTHIDAVEVFKNNIRRYRLHTKYRKVYAMNIIDFIYNDYDIVIFGDIIEHLTEKEARKVLDYAYKHCKEMIVAVPYQLKQDEVDGNKYEIHIQDDLTNDIVLKRYPMLKLLYKNELYGYYVKGE